MNLTCNKIGTVEVENDSFYIQLDDHFIEGTKSLEDFSHIQVIWWCHLLDNKTARADLSFKKPYKKGPETVGVFATRSPQRPNPIAISACQLLYIDGEHGRLYIPYIDAEPGTPILDIKPYQPCLDRVKDVSYPQWAKHWPQYYEDSATFNWADEFNF